MNNIKDRVTIYEVAKASGVSLATVSRVINNSDTVKEGTKKKVLDVINKLGYKPSGLAQALATNKTTNIGVIIPRANYVYIANLLNGISEVCREKAYNMFLFTTSHSRIEALNCLDKLIKGHVDGVIIFDDTLNEEDFEIFNSYNVPVVAINSNFVGPKIASISFGYEHSIIKIIQDHFNKGDKKMTFLHMHDPGRLLTRIESAFVKTHLTSDRDYDVINCDDSYSRTYQDFLTRFKSPHKEYIIAYRDSLAAAILNAATDSGLRVPDDIEVLSLIGTKYSSIIRPSITNLYIDLNEVGKRSMYMLMDLINKQLYEKQYKFESTYVKKQSTKF
ncbi:MAG: LacI family DNA-binding transcriptional regulator [Bacillales bacterium]